jgi:Uma2 family endonuclease
MSTVTRTKRPTIGRKDNGLLMSPEEFDAIDDYDENYSYELINGVLVVNPMPSHFERDPNEELGHWLRLYQDQNPGIIDKTLPEEYIRTSVSRRRADRVVWLGLGRVPNPEQDVPFIVIEFVSRRRRDQLRDYIEKRAEYLALGVIEYWVIDRFRRTLTVFRRSAGNDEEQLISEQETYRTTFLPGFELPLKKLLKVSDDWHR